MACANFSIVAVGFFGQTEVIVVLVIALLLFGKRVPEVARSLGRGITEFKRGVRGIEDDVDEASKRPSSDIQPPASSSSAPNEPTQSKS